MLEHTDQHLTTEETDLAAGASRKIGAVIKSGQLGIYGKLPVHGDFVSRRLTADFIRYWDEWLQRSLAISQSQMGDLWLDFYLVSPIWRFVLSPGVIDGNAWIGILVPSVDSVGRYFPLTVAMPLFSPPSLLDVFSQGEMWFQMIEESVLLALEENLTIDELDEKLSAISFCVGSAYVNGMCVQPSAIALQVPLEAPEHNPSTVLPMMFELFLRQSYNSYSAWWSQGSDYVDASFNVVPLLPDAGMFSSFLDGKWLERGWQVPYALADCRR